MDYKTAGVDVEAGRDFVQRIKGSVESTFRPEVLGGLGGFGGLIRIPEGFKKPLLVAGTDGVGTKLELAQDFSGHYGVGIDLVAMCINDVITSGAEPLFFLDYIATGAIGPSSMADVVEGIAEACRISNCALLGGETAEMPGFYSSGQYDLAGFCVGVVEEEQLIDGSKIAEGDQIIAIESSGVHSNGFSLVRKILEMADVNQETTFGKEKNLLINSLLKPTLLYSQLVRALINGKIPLHGMAHITGGGIPENLPRCLPKGAEAVVDVDSWERPAIFKWLQEVGNIPERDLWHTFNLGVGFCLVVETGSVNDALKICTESSLKAWVLGSIRATTTQTKEKRLIGLPE